MVYLTGIGFGLVNLGVWGIWQSQTWRGFMMRHFTLSLENLAKRRYHTLLTYAFSHHSALHGTFNTVAAYSFGKQLDNQLFSRRRFCVPLLFLSGSLVAGAGSLAFKHFARLSIPSLGASGGVFALLATSIAAFPNQEIRLIFAPWFAIPGLPAFSTLVGLDLMGILARWKYLDHAAHLSGTLAGLAMFHQWARRHPNMAYGGDQAARYYTDGSFYSGRFREGDAHGKGTMVWKSGARYDGEFVKGKLGGGYGEYYDQDGKLFFRGQFVRSPDGDRWIAHGHLVNPQTGELLPASWAQHDPPILLPK